MKTIKLIFNTEMGDYSLWVNNGFKGIHKVSGLNHTLTATLENVLTVTQAKTIQKLMSVAVAEGENELYNVHRKVIYSVLIK